MVNTILENLKDQKYRRLMYEDILEAILKGGSSIELAEALLYIVVNYYKEDFTDEELEDLVIEVHARLLADDGYKPRRNIQGEVLDAVSFRGTGEISINDIYNDLRLQTSEEKSACRMAVRRLVVNGQLEKTATVKSGMYRLIQRGREETVFLTAPKGEFGLWLPLDLHQLCKIFPQNMIVVAGSKSSGKTAVLLNIALNNQDKFKVVYINSEMGDEEFTERMIKLGCTKPEDIRFKVYRASSDYQDLIADDEAIYIVDYLEMHDEFYKVGKYLKAIHDKLKKGIAIVAIQMKTGGTLGRGGDFSKELSRLYLSMDYDPAMRCTRVGIEEMKAPKIKPGYRGFSRFVKIIDGSRLSAMNEWTDAKK